MVASNYGQQGIGGNVVIGKKGPRFRNSGGIVQLRNNADTAFARVQGADPVTDDDLVTRRWALANLGAATGREAGIPNPAIYYIDPANTSSVDLAAGSTSGVVADLEGNASAGALTSPASYSEGAFNFNGASGRVSFTKNTTLDDLFTASKPATVIAFIKPTTAGESSAGRIVSTQGSGGANTGWWLRLSTPGTSTCVLRFVRAFSTTNGDWDTDIACVPFNAWSAVAVSWNGSGVPNFYVNGPQANAAATTSPAGTAVSDSGDALVVGNNADDSATFNGQIGAVLIFDRVLTADEIKQITNLFLPRFARVGSVPGVVRRDKVGGSGTVSQNILANRDFQTPTVDSSGGGNVNLQTEQSAGLGIKANSDYSTIGGGRDSQISGDFNTVSGGSANDIGSVSASTGSVIGGGVQNQIQTGLQNTIGGGSANIVAPPSGSVNYVTIGGGQGNKIYGPATHSTISGGHLNEISSSTGGTAHFSGVGGGESNKIIGQYSRIGGGQLNEIGVTAFTQASWSVIPGGLSNRIDADYCFAFGRQARIVGTTFNGSWIACDDIAQNDDIDRARQHKLRYEGGFTRRTTAGFAEESWERFNAHGAASGVGSSVQIVLGNMGTNVRTLDVEVRCHGIRTNSSAGVLDAFKAAISFTAARDNAGAITIFDTDENNQGGAGTGTGCAASVSVLPTNDIIIAVTLPPIQPTSEDWQFTFRFERQVGGATS